MKKKEKETQDVTCTQQRCVCGPTALRVACTCVNLLFFIPLFKIQ